VNLARNCINSPRFLRAQRGRKFANLIHYSWLAAIRADESCPSFSDPRWRKSMARRSLRRNTNWGRIAGLAGVRERGERP
jgi:hypothetical protein